MFSKHRKRSLPTWLGTLLIIAGAMIFLSSCGGSTASTNTTASVTPPPTTAPITPTPTPTQAVATTPLPGTKQTIKIVTNSDGSWGFNPSSITIKVGTTVTWENVSSAPHTVTTDDGQTADSGTVAIGSSFSFTFKTAGTFPYHCNYHPYMRATIIVVG